MPIFEIQRAGKTYEIDSKDPIAASSSLDSMLNPAPEREPAAGNVPVGTTSGPSEDVGAGMALSGIPLLGRKIPQLEAAIRTGMNRLTGQGEPSYERNLAVRESDYEQAQRDQPIASGVLQAAGGTAALAPLGATALGARALGATGSLIPRIAAGGASGAALSAADTAVGGGDVEDIKSAAKTGVLFGMGGSALFGRARTRMPAFEGAPLGEELQTAVRKGHDAIRQIDPVYKQSAVQSGLQNIAKNVRTLSEDQSPGTWGVLQDAIKGATPPPPPPAPRADPLRAMTGVRPPAAPAPSPDAGMGFDDLLNIRKNLGGVARDQKSSATDVAAARTAQRELDKWFRTRSQTDMIRGNAKQVNALATQTAADSAAGFRLTSLESILERAQNSAAAGAGDLAGAYQTQMKNFLNPKKYTEIRGGKRVGISDAMREGFTDQEIEFLRSAIKGADMGRILRRVGQIMGNKLALGAGIFSPQLLPIYGGGLAAKYGANALMGRKAEAFNRMAAARSPLAQSMGVDTNIPRSMGTNIAPFGMALYPQDRNQ